MRELIFGADFFRNAALTLAPLLALGVIVFIGHFGMSSDKKKMHESPRKS